jgi:peptidoglycan/LPS O-acetylase OafA/YrhL
MTVLTAVAGAVGVFELIGAVWMNAPDRAGQLFAGVFAALFLGCAWALWARQSIAAALVVGLLLLADVAGLPAYQRTSVQDWVVQGVFGVVGIAGIVATVNVLRERRARRRRTAQPTAP